MNLRIKTKINSYNSYVYTVYHEDSWITYSYYNGVRIETAEANGLRAAGFNHLVLAEDLRDKVRAGTILKQPEPVPMDPAINFNEP
jgi:hypothetical protein